jgi:hypothetical protein
LEQLGHFNGGQDVAQEKDHRVRSSRNHDAGFHTQSQRLDELNPLDRCWVNPSNLNILSLPRRLFRIRGVPDIPSFRAEEEIQDELNTIDLI